MRRLHPAQKLVAFALCAAIGVTIGAKPDTARAQSNLPVIVQTYDGNYTSYLTIKEIKYQSQNLQGKNWQRLTCTLFDSSRQLMIKDAKVEFWFNTNIIITGTVSNDGVITGFGRSNAGGVRLNARIRGNDLVGETEGAYCIFTLRMKKT
jgi:hypothetical protein